MEAWFCHPLTVSCQLLHLRAASDGRHSEIGTFQCKSLIVEKAKSAILGATQTRPAGYLPFVVPQKPNSEQQVLRGQVFFAGTAYLPHSAWALQLLTHPAPQYFGPYPHQPSSRGGQSVSLRVSPKGRLDQNLLPQQAPFAQGSNYHAPLAKCQHGES